MLQVACSFEITSSSQVLLGHAAEAMGARAGESDSEGDAAVLVYRMACTLLSTEVETISTDLKSAKSDFITQQNEFVAKVGDAASNAQLFQSLCLPATDADHLEVTLPLRDVRPTTICESCSELWHL